MKISRIAAATIGAFAVVAVAGGAAAQTPPSKCSGGKIKNAGKKAAAKLTCLSKGLSKGATTDSTCLAKAEVKFSSSYAKAEAKVPNDCLTLADAPAIEIKVDALLSDIDNLVADAGGGTVQTCDAAKVKAAGKKAAAKLTCVSKAVTKATPLDSTCIAKAEVKFSSAAAKAEAKAPSKGLPCSATGDAGAYEALVDASIDDIGEELGFCKTCCGNTELRFTTTVGAGNCGTVVDATGAAVTPNGTLACSGLYFGGSAVAVPLPGTIPDQGDTRFTVSGCSSTTGAYVIGATTAAGTGSARTCSSSGEPNGYLRTGCLFGAPLAIPNTVTPAVSTCVVNRIAASASGTGNCDGTTAVSFNLGSDLFLTGDLLAGTPGIQTCPVCDVSLTGDACSGPSPCCHGGANDDLGCTPGTSGLNTSYPTSHDCPPPEGNFIGTLAIPFNLTTGSAVATATDTDGAGPQTEVFCGFCRNPVAPFAFQTPPNPCTSTATCTTAPFTTCQQRNEGAFGAGLAHTITDTGVNPGCLSDGDPHLGGLASTFCIPASGNGLVDGSADIPGPGAVQIPGNLELN